MKQKILAAVCALALCAALVPAGFAEQAAADTAPVAENLELTTFRGTSIGGTPVSYTHLRAHETL